MPFVTGAHQTSVGHVAACAGSCDSDNREKLVQVITSQRQSHVHGRQIRQTRHRALASDVGAAKTCIHFQRVGRCLVLDGDHRSAAAPGLECIAFEQTLCVEDQCVGGHLALLRGGGGNIGANAGLGCPLVIAQFAFIKRDTTDLDTRGFILLLQIQQPAFATVRILLQKHHRTLQVYFRKYIVALKHLKQFQRYFDSACFEQQRLLGPRRIGKRNVFGQYPWKWPVIADCQVTFDGQHPAGLVQGVSFDRLAHPVPAKQKYENCRCRCNCQQHQRRAFENPHKWQ